MPICILGFVKAMEDHKNEFILILAGYHTEMERFIKTNPGIHSRFPIHIDFPDYQPTQLLAIAEQMCEQRQYTLTPQSKAKLINLLTQPKSFAQEQEVFGNARTMRNIIEKAFRYQAVRLLQQKRITKEDLICIQPADLRER